MTTKANFSSDIDLVLTILKNGVPQTGKTLTYEVVDRVGDVVYSGGMTEHVTNLGTYLETITPSPDITTFTQYMAHFIEDGKVVGYDEIEIGSPSGEDTQTILDAIEETDRYADGSSH